MQFTNEFNLPEVFVNAVMADPYTKGKADISVTGLLRPPQMAALAERNSDKIVRDVSQNVWSLFGRAVHTVLEATGKQMGKQFVIEERIFAEHMGWTISGAIDVQEIQPDGTISVQDWKVRKAWGVMNDMASDEQQLNCYAQLLEWTGRKVSSLKIVAFVRDWKRFEAERNPVYPQTEVVVKDIPLWPEEQRIEFISKRVELHQLAAIHLTECTDEERWMRPTTYAIKKLPDGKRAIATFDDEKAALERLTSLNAEGEKYVIEVRQGEPVRCMNWCDAAPFCEQHQSYLQTLEAPNE